MSHPVNEKLYERAAEMITYWEGTPYAEVIKKALEHQNLDDLHQFVHLAEAEASRQELYSYNMVEDNDTY